MTSTFFSSTRYFIPILVLFLASAPRAQVCLGDITLPTQADVDVFECSRVTGSLRIGATISNDISDLTPLSGLTSVGDDFRVYGTSALTSLTGLESLTSIDGSLVLTYNGALESTTGLEGIQSLAGNLHIQSNPNLATLSGLISLESVGGYFGLNTNPSLGSLSGLENLGDIGGDFSLYGADLFTSLTELESLTYIGGKVTIWSDIESLEGLNSITSVGGLDVRNNNVLTSFSGLEGLTTIEGTLEIDGNDVLESLSGLENVSTIAGYANISTNTSLSSVTALESLTSVGGLVFRNNSTLGSLAGLENIHTVTGSLVVEDNASLRDCSCGLSGLISGDPPEFIGVGNSIIIEENSPDGQCNSPEEVLTATLECTPTASEPLGGDSGHFALDAGYPNPFRPSTGVVHFKVQVNEAGPVQVVVYDTLGREVTRLMDENASAGTYEVAWDGVGANGQEVAAGTYLVRMHAGQFYQAQPVTVLR